MKKLLMGTTAVAGAVAILGGAAAMAQEAPTLTINGTSRFAVYMADQDQRDGIGKGYKFSTENTEIHFNLAGQADNGLRYALKVEMDANAHNQGNADEIRIRLQGDWGIVDLGDEDGVEDLMPVGGYRILAGRGGWDGGIFNIFNPIGVKRTAQGVVGDTSDATKISYYTPRIAGFQAGVSFTPNVNQDGQAKRSDRDDTGFQNHWALGLAYQETFNEVSVSLGGAYSWATAKRTVFGERENVRAYSLGGWVGYAGFRVGGGYGNSGRSGEQSVNPNYSRDSWWDVAADYTMGPWRASVGHFRATGKSAVVGISDDRTEITQFGVTYSIAPGLNAFGEVDLVRVRRDTTLGGTNKGTVGIIGTNVSF